jgi:hypothetical protein
MYIKLAEDNELYEFVPELWSTMVEFGVRNMVEDGSLIKSFVVLMAKYDKNDEVSAFF